MSASGAVLGLFLIVLMPAAVRVVAAGNEGSNNDAIPSYPSCDPNAKIISVASITSTGALSSFSSYGLTTVDLGASGSSIDSTVPSQRGDPSYASTAEPRWRRRT